MVTAKPHAALVASPGMGHLIPMVELGKRLLTHHGFHVTIFVVTTDTSTTTSQILQQTSNLSALNIVVIPPIDVTAKLGPKPSLGARVGLTMIESLSLLRSSILSMKLPPSTLIVDIFGTVALPMAREFRMSTYVFFATSAWFSAVTIYLPVIDKQMEERHVNNHEPLYIPGCEPVRFEDTLEPFLSPGGPAYEGYLRAAKDVLSADGILMNTWQDLEPAATKAVREPGILGRFTNGPVYPVGPLVRTIEPIAQRSVVLGWLDGQPAESVMYVSFGSGGTMSEAQMTELAWGLELSQQRFVWVVRPPMEGDTSGSFFNVAGERRDGTPDYLPEGFVKRTKEVGLVVPMWAPQAEILGHPATGGFVTHCGWNSVLESILNGVPMVAWPLYAEQKMNAFMLTEELGVAVRAKAGEEDEGVVRREKISELVRRVMVDKDGIAMRTKVKELKSLGDRALSKFGSSHEPLCQMTKDCEFHLQGSVVKARGA
ncbi:UDP-glycosyltransferase 72E1-like [Gastrolobium bilobum]|uniref:UDP-glycosyltransferase 72E1-like n=1 Tax=Gastrolobium bilobum TaxID=150636 RepID=UPI002AB2843C|nr:UDP-glycosyltransferase 72E1-like [Gastrolobium bilobum]